MGCCETRSERKDTDLQIKTNSWESYNRVSKSDSQLDVPQSPDYPPEILQSTDYSLPFIEDYSVRLIASPRWICYVDDKQITVKSLPSSIYHPRVPVLLGFIDFGCTIPALTISHLVCKDRSWDSTVLKFIAIESKEDFHVIRVVKKYPFINREYCTKVFCRDSEDSCSIIFVPAECEGEVGGLAEKSEMILEW